MLKNGKDKVAKQHSSQITVGTEPLTLDPEDPESEGIAQLLNEEGSEKNANYENDMKNMHQGLGTMCNSIDVLIGFQFKAIGQASLFTASSILSNLRTPASEETTTALSEISVKIQELVRILASLGIRMKKKTSIASLASTQITSQANLRRITSRIQPHIRSGRQILHRYTYATTQQSSFTGGHGSNPK